MVTTEIAYTVRARQLENVKGTGPYKGEVLWLDWVTEGGGWPQWRSSCNPEDLRFHYPDPKSALKMARKSCKMPWWCVPDRETFEVYRLIRKTEFTVEKCQKST